MADKFFWLTNFSAPARNLGSFLLMFLFTFCAAIHNNHIANDTWSQEFLLNGPTNEMGMVVTAGGVSQHQPLWWSDTFRGAAYSYPYVLVMGRLTITVHSILDQKEKQVRWFKVYFRVSGKSIVKPPSHYR